MRFSQKDKFKGKVYVAIEIVGQSEAIKAIEFLEKRGYCLVPKTSYLTYARHFYKSHYLLAEIKTGILFQNPVFRFVSVPENWLVVYQLSDFPKFKKNEV